MKKWICLLLAAASLFALSACGHKHVWQEASCTAPKTCAECGETEGDPLGHSPTEATYWAPSLCAVCGEQLAEKLVPDFERCGFSVIDVKDLPTENVFTLDEERSRGDGYTFECSGLPYVTGASKSSEHVCGFIALKNREVFDSDETHPAAPGYEWRSYEFELLFPDTGNGYRIAFSDDDYYDVKGRDDSVRGLRYTVNWQGQEYPDCMRIVTYAEAQKVNCSVTGPGAQLPSIQAWQHPCYVSIRVPVGYDGAVFCFLDSQRTFLPGMHITDMQISESEPFIRLT